MYCPACDKEFSPVHSRCPECKGWLRVSGPTVGAKAAINPIRPPATGNVESATTQKVKPIRSNDSFQLPSRPKSAPEAEPAARKQDHLPGPGLQTATEPVESKGRGALGTGWESSNSFAAPPPGTAPPISPSSWGAPAPVAGTPAAPSGWGVPATGGWGAAAPAAPEPLKAMGWGGSAAPGFGAPAPAVQPVPPSGAFEGAGGLGGGNGGFAPASTGPGFAGGLGSGPASGQLGGPAALGGGPPGGGGWLGDGSGGGNAGAGAGAYAPPARGGGWLGDAAAGPGAAPPPLSMPPLAPPELSSSSHDALALPDHTVAVDLGTPWEDEVPHGASNQMIYIVLGCLILSLTAFSGYIFWQQRRLKEPVKPVPIENNGGALKLGQDSLRQAQAAFKAKRYHEAQSLAQNAFDLVGELTVASEEQRRAVKGFYRQATMRYAASLCEEAQRAGRNGEIVQAGGLAEQAASMYAKMPDTKKEQAQSFALEGRIYLNSGDPAAAMSAYSKANSLRPGAYSSEMRQARAMGAPPPEVLPQQQVAQPLTPEEQPKIDAPAYPSGHSSGYRGSRRSDPVPAAQPVGPAPRSRPVNTYVPPKKDDRPSWRKKPSDRYPGS